MKYFEASKVGRGFFPSRPLLGPPLLMLDRLGLGVIMALMPLGEYLIFAVILWLAYKVKNADVRNK
jgi:hypothetical protein